MQIKKYCIKTLIIFLDHILDVSMNDFNLYHKLPKE